MAWTIRLATEGDLRGIAELIPLSVRALQANHYSTPQMEAALGPVFGVDVQLIADGTYFVAVADGEVVGCGGWSKRRSTFGSSLGRGPEPEIDPGTEAARIRAFFVHPAWARRGIGRAILGECERALQAAGFRRAEIAATLTGEALYRAAGYEVTGRFDIALSNGLALPCVRLAKEFGEFSPVVV